MDQVYWVIPGLLAGRPSGRNASWDLGMLRDSGFRTVLSLDTDHSEMTSVEAVGLKHFLIHMSGKVPPDESDESAAGIALARTRVVIEDEIAQERPVLVHCAAGRDRTALVLAYFLLRSMNITPSEAIAFVRERRIDALTAPGWHEFAVRLLERVGRGGLWTETQN